MEDDRLMSLYGPWWMKINLFYIVPERSMELGGRNYPMVPNDEEFKLVYGFPEIYGNP